MKNKKSTQKDFSNRTVGVAFENDVIVAALFLVLAERFEAVFKPTQP